VKAKLLKLIGGLAGAAAVAAGVVYLFEDFFIFWPSRRLHGAPDPPFHDIALEPAPGTHIYGWHIPHPLPRAMVIYFQGNGGNRSDRVAHVEMLRGMAVSVLLVDYEGYGVSEGSTSEAAVYRDAREIIEWVRRDSKLRELPLVYYGESLGGAVATQMALENPPHALIIDHSFTTMGEMIDRVCRGVPLRYVCRSRFNSIENLSGYHGPVLVIHGEEDRLIPILHGQRLFEAANNPKWFLSIPGAGHNHNDLLRIGGAAYRAGIYAFLDETLKRV